MVTVCALNQCTGCRLCIEACPQKCIQMKDSLKSINAVIDTSQCVNCGLCHKQCQVENALEAKEPLFLMQGWATDDHIREHASSGGFASAIEKAFVLKGGVVCSCTYENGDFVYKIADTTDRLRAFSGSKYVKSNMSSIYKDIKKLLISGKKVLFVGLPCHSAALQKYISKRHSERLYTIDLICHGTPSKKMLEKFLEQYHLKLIEVSEIRFRNKERFFVSKGEKCVDMPGIMDAYSIAFMHALTYTDNCYQCQYAMLNRISDLTLGDSWGSDMPEKDKKQGVSLVLCQTEKGEELLQSAKLNLLPVEAKKAIANNAQLKHPSEQPKSRERFFNDIYRGIKFNKAVFCAMPKQFMKQKIKGYLIRIGIKEYPEDTE